jgi:nucleoside-diphosphate-sugar epimerase
MGKVALVVGGTGMAGNGIVPHLLNQRGAEHDTVICLSLSVDEETFASRTTRKCVPLRCNLDDKEAVVKGLADIGSPAVTDIYWFTEANRPPKLGNVLTTRRLLAATDRLAPLIHRLVKASPQLVGNQLYGTMSRLAGSGVNERNQLWIKNVLDALQEIDAPVRVFVLGTGGKHYGMHLGPSLWPGYSSPFQEDKAKAPGPLSYFDMQAFVRQRAAEDGFTWNEVRPTFIIGLAPELSPSTQSFGIALATYASILKAQGKQLRYPGTDACYNAMINLNTSERIAEVAVWSTDHPNQAFNCPSCPPFSWRQVWGEIAAWFGMEPADPARKLLGESSELVAGPDAPRIWKHLRSAHSLAGNDLECLLNYSFLDKSLMVGYDAVSDTAKLKKFGFPEDRINEYPSGSACMTAFFERLVKEKIIPNPADIVTGSYRT